MYPYTVKRRQLTARYFDIKRNRFLNTIDQTFLPPLPSLDRPHWQLTPNACLTAGVWRMVHRLSTHVLALKAHMGVYGWSVGA